jgi:hypothetical protein
MNPEYRVALIDSIEGMAPIAREWNGLLKKSRSNTIFLTWEWLYSWAESFLNPNRRLFILQVYKENKITGLAPWCIRHTGYRGNWIKQIGFLGTPEAGSDYLDVFSIPGKEKEVARSIYQFLKGSTSLWDVLVLKDISSDSLFLLHMLNQMEADGKYVELCPASFCPSAALPKTEEVFLAHLSSHRRKHFLRECRILLKEGGGAFQSARLEDLDFNMEEFYRIYRERWGISAEHVRFLENYRARCQNKHLMQVDLLTAGGKNVAALLLLGYGETLSLYFLAVDRSFETSISLASVLVGLSIKNAIREGFSTYDFLKGTEDYKFLWANQGKRSLEAIFYGKKLGPLLWMMRKSMKSMAKVLLR